MGVYEKLSMRYETYGYEGDENRNGKPFFINPYKIKKVYQKQEKTFDNTQKDQQGEFERRRRAKEAFQQPP